MRYIADDNGYLLQVSFGAMIECNGRGCTEYTGEVPDGYDDLADWFDQEGDQLHRWHIVEGDLTLDSDAPEPEVYVPPVEPKVSMTLLWENDRPTEAFAARTVELDLQDYDAVAIEFGETWQTAFVYLRVGRSGSATMIGDVYTATSGYFYVAQRDIYVTTDGVRFSTGFHKYANRNVTEENNSNIIPYKIFGIKGLVNTIPAERTAICGTFLCGEVNCGQ